MDIFTTYLYQLMLSMVTQTVQIKKVVIGNINEHPSLCWLTTVLTHELQHAWQADDVHLGYRVKSNDMPLVEGMDKQWRRNLYEYDAEVGATKIRKFYITLMKENIEESDGR